MAEKFAGRELLRAGDSRSSSPRSTWPAVLIVSPPKTATGLAAAVALSLAMREPVITTSSIPASCASAPTAPRKVVAQSAPMATANGFCFINNIAVAAKYLQKKYGIKKVAIIDFDVHHGNGTQEIFFKDSSVAYGSSHEFPLFPGTGAEKENGVGNIFNATIKAGTASKEFMEIFDRKILDPIDKFKPEVVLISAGFDAHFRDPLANINLNSKDFFQITKKIVEIANIHSKGRIISFLEGGYDLVALSESIIEHLKALESHI